MRGERDMGGIWEGYGRGSGEIAIERGPLTGWVGIWNGELNELRELLAQVNFQRITLIDLRKHNSSN